MPTRRKRTPPRKKKLSGKRPAVRRKARSPVRPRHFGWLLHLLIIATVLLAGYTLWLDRLVRQHFEGRRWALPASVYARPLELYARQGLTLVELLTELRLLGYRSVPTSPGPGEYHRQRQQLFIHTRGFQFPDGSESPTQLKVKFSGPLIKQITDAHSGRMVSLYRLDPVLIGKIYPAHKQDRELLRMEQVPKGLINALLAAEDRHFYQHIGIDPIGILRALWTNLRAGAIRQGGSTLTQQLVKNFYLTRERTLARKLNEVLMALLLEWHYSKDDILQAYINEVFLGQDGSRSIHGFGEAARFYYGRPLNELGTGELAMLAGLVRGPSYYNPRRHPQRARKRRNLVLSLMAKQGRISPARARQVARRHLAISPRPSRHRVRYPGFMDLVRRQLHRDYHDQDLRSAGLRIFTTLDPLRQRQAEKALRTSIIRIEKRRHARHVSLQGALILVGSQNGEVQALVAGRDPVYAGFNRVLDAHRPIGSLAKPAVYLTALADPAHYNLISPLDDHAISRRDPAGKMWIPHNYDKTEHGQVPLYVALAHSYNLATVYLGLKLGIGRVQHVLRRLGVERKMGDYPSLFLGALELSPEEVARMYLSFASGGYRMPLRTVRAVQTRDGHTLQRYNLDIHKIMEPGEAFLINYLLTRVIAEGTGHALSRRLPTAMPLAGKTGTTNDLRDSWFAGYGGDSLAVVWLGRDDNRSAGLTGASGAMQVWADLMQAIRVKPIAMQAPADIIWRWVKPETGVQTDAQCQGARRLPFLDKTPAFPYQACAGTGVSGRGFMDMLKGLFE